MAKACCLCGRDLGKNNIDIGRKITCDRCVMGYSIHKYDERTPGTLGAQIEIVRKLYQEVSEGRQGVLAIQYLERVTGQEFFGSNNEKDKIRDFHKKMNSWLQGGFFSGEHLKQLILEKQWSHRKAAIMFECKPRLIGQMIKGHKPLINKAVNLLLSQDLWKTTWIPHPIYPPPQKPAQNDVENKEVNVSENVNISTSEETQKYRGKRTLAPLDCSPRCYKCKKPKDDAEITIDTISPYRSEYICEDCLREKDNPPEARRK